MMFVVAATTVLLMLGFVVASSVEAHFEDLDMEVLSGKLELTRQALQSVTSQEGLMPFTHQLARSLIGHHGLEVMVFDADGALVFATAHANFDPALVTRQALLGTQRPALWELDGKTYRGVAAQMPTSALDSRGHPVKVTVVAATDTTHHQVYMQSFLQTLWLVVAGAAVLTGGLWCAADWHRYAPCVSRHRWSRHSNSATGYRCKASHWSWPN
jgi:two-component system heavy metal sensor histidine kinase CusS